MRHTARNSILGSDIVSDGQEQMSLTGMRESIGADEQLLPRFAAYYTHLKAYLAECARRCNGNGTCRWPGWR